MTHLRPAMKKELVDLERGKTARPLEEDYAFREEDEINLLDYLIILLRHKKLIIGMVLLAGLASLVMTGWDIKLYTSRAIITPQQGGIASFSQSNPRYLGATQYGVGSTSIGKLLMMLDSRQLTARVIGKHNLIPVLFPELWDKKANKWKVDNPPTLHLACEAMKELLTAAQVKSATRNRAYRGETPIVVSIRHKDPETAKEFVEYYLTELSKILRGEALRDAAEKKRFLEEQLETIIDPLMKEKIHILRANEIEKETFAKAQSYYGFTILDPPIVPSRLSAKKSKRMRNVVLAMTAALFLAVFLAFIIEYIRRIKTDDKERYQEMIRELKAWKNDKGNKD